MEVNNLKIVEERNRLAKKAGLFFLLIIASSILTLIFVDPQYSVSGDVVETLKNVVENDFFFRINIAYTLLMYVGVIALNVYLYELLKVVNKPLALIAFSFRLSFSQSWPKCSIKRLSTSGYMLLFYFDFLKIENLENKERSAL